jgi:hypothetical protein
MSTLTTSDEYPLARCEPRSAVHGLSVWRMLLCSPTPPPAPRSQSPLPLDQLPDVRASRHVALSSFHPDPSLQILRQNDTQPRLLVRDLHCTSSNDSNEITRLCYTFQVVNV